MLDDGPRLIDINMGFAVFVCAWVSHEFHLSGYIRTMIPSLSEHHAVEHHQPAARLQNCFVIPRLVRLLCKQEAQFFSVCREGMKAARAFAYCRLVM